MKNKFKRLLSIIIIVCLILGVVPAERALAAKPNGSKENPYSAYKSRTIDVYGIRYLGKFKIKLLDCKSGKDALKYLKENGVSKKPGNSKEYVYLKFKIRYLSGDEEIYADSVINDYWGFFDSKSKKQIKGKSISVDDGTKDVSDVLLHPGDSAICSKALMIKSGNTPITYRISAGYDENYREIEKWFTTKKKK